MNKWYVIAPNGEQELGPFTGAQLVALAKAGRIKGTTLLKNDEVTKGKRIQASTIKQLQDVFTAPRQAEIVEPEQHPEDMMIEAGKKILSSAATNIGHTFKSIKSLIPSRTTEVTVQTDSAIQASVQPPVLAEPANSSLANFAGDGQDTSMVAKLLDRVNQICMSHEKPLYMAIQQRPVANFSPDAVVLTTHRLMMVQQKILGRMNFIDFPWREVKDIHVKENVISATISFVSMNGIRRSMDWLPKDQARKVYRIAQEQEENAHNARRNMYLEEQRASAAQTVVNTTVQAIPQPIIAQAAPVEVDPVKKLQQLKQMLDAELITQDEYNAKKAELLAQM